MTSSRNHLISVVLSTYNHGAYLRYSIPSILNQTHSNLELLIIDDGSTDDTKEVVESFPDPRIKYLYGANRGVSSAANRGLALAQGDVIALMAGDDISELHRFETQLRYLDEHHFDLVFSRPTLIDEGGEALPDEFYGRFFSFVPKTQAQFLRLFFFNTNYLLAPSMLARREVFRTLGGFKPSLLQLQDFELWIRAISRFKFVILADRLVRYRMRAHGANLSSSMHDNRTRAEMVYVYRHFFDDIPYPLLRETFPEHISLAAESDPRLLEIDLDFLYLAQGHAPVQLIAIERLCAHIDNPEMRELLLKHKNFSEKDLFEKASLDVFGKDLSPGEMQDLREAGRRHWVV